MPNALLKPSRGKTPTNHVGQRFGKLTVRSFSGRRIDQPRSDGARPRYHTLWLCVCDCGQQKTATARDLVRGNVRSCGCLALVGLAGGGHNALAAGESAFNQLLCGYKRSAIARGYSFTLSQSEFRALVTSPCFYCGSQPSRVVRGVKNTNGEFVANGVDRIDNDQGYDTGNVRPCCYVCNRAKGTMPEPDFIEWAKRLAARFGS